jgi:hypothetical protein
MFDFMTFRHQIVILLSSAATVAALTAGGLILTWQPWNLRDGGKIQPSEALAICLCGGGMAFMSFVILGLIVFVLLHLAGRGRPNKVTGPNAGGPRQPAIRMSLTARVRQFCR